MYRKLLYHYLILTYFFMFALSQTLQLFKVNLHLLCNTLSPDNAQDHLEQNPTASCPHCWSTGFTKREIPIQCYTNMEMYTNKCNECTYSHSVSEVLSEDVRLSIYFHFKALNTFQNNMSRIFRIVSQFAESIYPPPSLIPPSLKKSLIPPFQYYSSKP